MWRCCWCPGRRGASVTPGLKRSDDGVPSLPKCLLPSMKQKDQQVEDGGKSDFFIFRGINLFFIDEWVKNLSVSGVIKSLLLSLTPPLPPSWSLWSDCGRELSQPSSTRGSHPAPVTSCYSNIKERRRRSGERDKDLNLLLSVWPPQSKRPVNTAAFSLLSARRRSQRDRKPTQPSLMSFLHVHDSWHEWRSGNVPAYTCRKVWNSVNWQDSSWGFWTNSHLDADFLS